MDFAATFIPTDLEWLREWDAQQHQDTPSLDADSTLLRLVCDRLRWEVAAEFGYRSRLGSSVEQAGSLAAGVDPRAINQLLPALLSRLQNEIEPLRQARSSQVQQLVVGLLHHWRQRGGLDLRWQRHLRVQPKNYLDPPLWPHLSAAQLPNQPPREGWFRAASA